MNFEQNIRVIPAAAIGILSTIAIIFYGLVYNWALTNDLIIYRIMDKLCYIIPGDALNAANLLIYAATAFVILFTFAVALDGVLGIIELVKRNIARPAKTGIPCLILLGALGLALIADIFHNFAYIACDYSILNEVMSTSVMSTACIICILILVSITVIFWLLFLYRVYKAKEAAANESEIPDNE